MTLPKRSSSSPQSWKSAVETQLFRIACVHTGDEWRHEIREKVLAKFSPHERRNRFVARPAAACARTARAEFAAWFASRSAASQKFTRGPWARAPAGRAVKYSGERADRPATVRPRGPIPRSIWQAVRSPKNSAARRRNEIRPFRSASMTPPKRLPRSRRITGSRAFPQSPGARQARDTAADDENAHEISGVRTPKYTEVLIPVVFSGITREACRRSSQRLRK